MTERNWAIQALGEDKLHRIEELMAGAPPNESDRRTIETGVLAHNLALLDLMVPNGAGQEDKSSLDWKEIEEAAARLFDIQAALMPPRDRDQLLELSCVALMGNRTETLRARVQDGSWPAQNPRGPGTNAEIPWDQKVERTARESWQEILLAENPESTGGRVESAIQSIIDHQTEEEGPFLQEMEQPEARSMAIRLVGLYHWMLAARHAVTPDPERMRDHLTHARTSFIAQGDHCLELLTCQITAAAEAREQRRSAA